MPRAARKRSASAASARHRLPRAPLHAAARLATASIDRVCAAPAYYSAAFVMLLTILSIGANALFLQDRRHPAPLFGSWPETPVKTMPAVSARDEDPPLPPSRNAALSHRRPELVDAGIADRLPEIDEALVSEIQRLLSERGLYSGPIDGVIGPRTDAAIRKYQSSIGLPPTGVANPTLLEQLRGERPAVGPTNSIDEISSSKHAPTDPHIVRVVQAVLNEIGYGPLEVDGIMGSRTKAAILRFARKNGLRSSGDIDVALLRELEKVVGSTAR